VRFTDAALADLRASGRAPRDFTSTRLMLPLNTDQQLMSAYDCDSSHNIAPIATYLTWAIEDLSRVVCKLFLTPALCEERFRGAPAGRWNSEASRLESSLSKEGLMRFLLEEKWIDMQETIRELPMEDALWLALVGELGETVRATAGNMCAEGVEPGQALVHVQRLVRLSTGLVQLIVDNVEDREALKFHPSLAELERCGIALQCLRGLALAELPTSQLAKHESGRRLFTRASSLMLSSVLHCALGVVAIGNCKSGLDRTGIWSAAQLAVASVWELYPRHRWSLMLAATNWNLTRGRVKSDPVFGQPPPPPPSRRGSLSSRADRTPLDDTPRTPHAAISEAMAGDKDGDAEWEDVGSPVVDGDLGFRVSSDGVELIEEEDLLDGMAPASQIVRVHQRALYLSTLDERSPPIVFSRPHYAESMAGVTPGDNSPFSPERAQRCRVGSSAEEWGTHCQFDGDGAALIVISPLTSLLKNFMLIYTTEVNARITFASCGVRGLK